MIIFKKKFGVSDFLSQLLNYIGKLILNFNRKNLNKYKFPDQIIGFTDELITDTINFEGLYEKRELLTLISWLKPFLPKFYKSTMIDVGANIGNHTLFFSNYFGKFRFVRQSPQAISIALSLYIYIYIYIYRQHIYILI